MSSGLQVPDGWEWKKVGSFTTEHKQGYYTKEAYTDAGVYLVRITDLCNPHVDYSEMPCLTVNDKEYEQFKVEVGDFLFARSGAIGRYGIVTEEYPTIFASYIIRFRFDDQKVSTRYFGYIYESELCQRQLGSITQGSSNININAENIKSLYVPFPPLPEQKEIASILTSVDDVIEKTEAQISKLQDLKKGMMTELLTKGIGHTEFNDSPVGRIPVSWDMKRLEAVVDKKRPITYGIVQAGQHVEDGVPYIRVSDMTTGKLSPKGMMRTSREIAKKFIRSEVKCGDIVYALRGKIGLVMVVPETLSGANLTQGTARIASISSINTDFLLWTMQSPIVLDQSELEAKGSTFQEITLGKLKQLWMTIPPIDEQVKIASIFNSLEKNIESKQQKLSQTKSLKKALMNDLLTGKVRVSTTN